MGSGSPANFQLATPFRSRLRVRHGTDRRPDDGHQRLMPPPYGGEGLIRILSKCTYWILDINASKGNLQQNSYLGLRGRRIWLPGEGDFRVNLDRKQQNAISSKYCCVWRLAVANKTTINTVMVASAWVAARRVSIITVIVPQTA